MQEECCGITMPESTTSIIPNKEQPGKTPEPNTPDRDPAPSPTQEIPPGKEIMKTQIVVNRNQDKRAIPDAAETVTIRSINTTINTAGSVDSSWLDPAPMGTVHSARDMFTIPEDTLITENKTTDAVIAVTEDETKQLTATHQKTWNTLCKDLSQTIQQEQTLRHDTRTFMLLNCNGMERVDTPVWESIETKASQVNADIVALTETHVKAADSAQREQLEESWNIGHPGWIIHHATNELSKQGGVAFIHKSHLQYDTFRNIKPDGTPTNAAEHFQGRYLIAMPLRRDLDRTDFVVVYATNSGAQGTRFSLHVQLANDISRLRKYWIKTYPNRVLLTIGDLNFSSQESRSVKPTTYKGMELEPSEYPMKPCKALTTWKEKNPTTSSRFMPGISDREFESAQATWIEGREVLDLVKHRTHSDAGWMVKKEHLKAQSRRNYTSEVPGFVRPLSSPYIRATLDYILTTKLDINYIQPDDASRQLCSGIVSGCIFARSMPYNKDVPAAERCHTDHSPLVSAYLVTRPLQADDNRRLALGMSLKYLVGITAGDHRDKHSGTSVGWLGQSAAADLARDFVTKSGYLTSYSIRQSILSALCVLRTTTPKEWLDKTDRFGGSSPTDRKYRLDLAQIYRQCTFNTAANNAGRLVCKWEKEAQNEPNINVVRHPEDIQRVLYHKFTDGDTPNEIVERAGTVTHLNSNLPCKSSDFDKARKELTKKLKVLKFSAIWVETTKPNKVRYRRRHPNSGSLNLPVDSKDLQAFYDTIQSKATTRIKDLINSYEKYRYLFNHSDELDTMWRVMHECERSTEQDPKAKPSMQAAVVQLEKYVELTWSKPDTFTDVDIQRMCTSNKENFNRAQRTAKTLLRQAQLIQSDRMRPLYAEHTVAKSNQPATGKLQYPDNIARPEWRWVAVAYTAHVQWIQLTARYKSCLHAHTTMIDDGITGVDRVLDARRSNKLTKWTSLETRAANICKENTEQPEENTKQPSPPKSIVEDIDPLNTQQHTEQVFYRRGPAQYIDGKIARELLSIPSDDLKIAHNILSDIVANHSRPPTKTWMCIRWGDKIATGSTGNIPTCILENASPSWKSTLTDTAVLNLAKQLDIGGPNPSQFLTDLIDSRIGNISTHKIECAKSQPKSIWLIDVDANKHDYSQIYWDAPPDDRDHKGISQWLRANPSGDRWITDADLRNLHPKYLRESKRGMMGGSAYTTKALRSSSISNELHEAILSSRMYSPNIRNTIDIRMKCEQRNNTALVTWMWVGNVTDPNKRIRMKVLLDSGCSMVVANSCLQNTLSSLGVTTKQSTMPAPLIHAAVSGPTYGSSGLMDLGITLTNANHLGNGKGPPTNEVLVSAWMVDDLSYDLILGTPFFADIITHFKWDATVSDPKCGMLDMDECVPPRSDLAKLAPMDRLAELTRLPGFTRHRVTAEQDDDTANQWHREVNNYAEQGGRLKTRTMVTIQGHHSNSDSIEIQVQHEKSEDNEAYLVVLDSTAHASITEGSPNGFCVVTAMIPGANWKKGQHIDIFGAVGSYQDPTGLYNMEYEIHDTRSVITSTEGGGFITKLVLNWKLTEEADPTFGPLEFTITPGIPLGWAKTPISEEAIKTKWQNESIDCAIDEDIREQAGSIIHEWRQQNNNADVGRMRIRTEQFINNLLDTPTMSHCVDHNHIEKALTWAAHMVSALPHLTRNLLGNPKWMRIMNIVNKHTDAIWHGAKTAQEHLFTMLKANQMGLRANEIDDDFIVNTDGEISVKSAMILANLPPLTDVKDDSRPNSLARYSDHAWKRMAVLGDLLLKPEGGTDPETNSTTSDQTSQQQAQYNTSDIVKKAKEWKTMLQQAEWADQTDKRPDQVNKEIKSAKDKRAHRAHQVKSYSLQEKEEHYKADLQSQLQLTLARQRQADEKCVRGQYDNCTAHIDKLQRTITNFRDTRDLTAAEFEEVCSNLEAGEFNNASTPSAETFHQQNMIDWERQKAGEQTTMSEDEVQEKETKAKKKAEMDLKRKDQQERLAKNKAQALKKQAEDLQNCKGSEATREPPIYMHELDEQDLFEDPDQHPEGKATQHTYGEVEDDRLPMNVEVDWEPTELERETTLYKIWHNITERQRRHLKLIDWIPKGMTIMPGIGEGLDGLSVEEAKSQERALTHTMVYHLGTNYMDTWDVDPWSPPCVKTHAFGPEYLTMITKEPVFIPPRPLADEQLKAAVKQTEEMIRSGLAVRAVSAWNSPVLCVPKPLGRGETKRKYRTCVDARGINSRTVKISYPLQPTHEALEQAQGYERYTCSDACAGFHQLAVDPSIAHKLAYSCGTSMKVVPLRMAMGGVNSMSAFLYCLDRAIGYMRTGCCELSNRNQLIKDIRGTYYVRMEQGKPIERTKFNLGKNKRRHFADSVEDMEKMWTCMGNFERVQMTRYMDLAEKEYPNKDGQIPDTLPDPCEGVPMLSTKHRCLGSAYVDDILQGFTSSGIGSQYRRMMEGLQCISKLLEALDRHGIRLKAQKTSIMARSLKFLGWDLSSVGLRPNDKRCQGIDAMTDPRSPTEIKSVLGGLQYYRRLIPNCAQLEYPLYELTRKGVEWDYDPNVHGESIRQLKKILTSDAILTPWDPNGGRAVLLVDTSAVAAGAVLAQENDKGEERPCAYASAQLTSQQRGYSASEREMIGVRLAFARFRHMIATHHITSGKGKRQMTKLVTDHDALKQTIQARSVNPRLNKWAMQFMGLQCEVEVRAGTKLALPDMISRCTSGADNDLLRKGVGHEPTQWILKAGFDDTYYETKSDYGKHVRIHFVKGPTSIDSSKAGRPMIQRRRRDMRYFMRSALCNIDNHLKNKDELTTYLKLTAEKIRKGLAAGSSLADKYTLTDTYEEPEGHTPIPSTDMGEERYIADTTSPTDDNGMTNIIRMGMGSNLKDSERTYETCVEKYGQDWYTRIAKVDETGTTPDLWIYKTGECIPLEDIIKEYVPEDEIPKMCYDESFMMSFAEDPTCNETPVAHGITPEYHDIEPSESVQCCTIHDTQLEGPQCINLGTTIKRDTSDHAIQPMMADNFCGIGGVFRGFIMEGFQIGTTCEKAWEQQQLVCQEFNGHINPLRLFESLTYHQFLGHFAAFSSAPCTPFSRAGSQRGFQDHRASLYMEQVVPLLEAQVPIIWCENVPEVARTQKRHNGDSKVTSPLQELLERLTSAGYKAEERTINALDCGASISRRRTFVQAIHPNLHAHMARNREHIIKKLSRHRITLHHSETNNDSTFNGTSVQEHEFTENGFIWPKPRFKAQRGHRSEQQATEDPNKMFHIELNQTLAHHMIPWDQVPERYKMNKQQLSEFQVDDMHKEAVIHVARRKGDSSLGDWHNPSIIISSEGAAASITALGNSRLIQDEHGNIRRLMPCEVLSIMGFQIGGENQLYKSILRTKQNYYGDLGETLLDKDSKDFHRREEDNGVERISNTVVQNLCTTDSTLYQWGGNAVPVQMSASLARATMAMHDEHWMKQHSQQIWDKLQIREKANAQGVQLDNSIPLPGGMVALDADKITEADQEIKSSEWTVNRSQDKRVIPDAAKTCTIRSNNTAGSVDSSWLDPAPMGTVHSARDMFTTPEDSPNGKEAGHTDKMTEADQPEPSGIETESNIKQAKLFENSLSEAKKEQLTVHSMQMEKMLEKQNTLAELSKQKQVTKRQTRNFHRQRNLLDQHVKDIEGKVQEASRSLKCTGTAYRQFRKYLKFSDIPADGTDDVNEINYTEDVYYNIINTISTSDVEDIVDQFTQSRQTNAEDISSMVDQICGADWNNISKLEEETEKLKTTTTDHKGVTTEATVLQTDPSLTVHEIKAAMKQVSPGLMRAEMDKAILKKKGKVCMDEAHTWKEMRKSQMTDLQYHTLIQYCETKMIPANPQDRHFLETKDTYVMHQGLLYRIWDSGQKLDGSYMQLCIPREYQIYLVRQYHNKLGHPSSNVMYEALRRRYHWTSCWNDCVAFTIFCDGCQRYKDKRPAAKIGRAQYSYDSGLPGQTVLIDAIGPYGGAQHATKKCRYSGILIQDEFTRFIKLYPVEHVDSLHISRALLDWAETFGWMETIKSDCATNMVSEGIRQFYKDAGVNKTESAAYRPQSHGKIERVIQYLNASIRTTMAGDRKGWDDIAGAMASAWNALPKRFLYNNCPFYLMFGRRPPNQIDLHPHFPIKTEQHTLKNWVQTNLERIQTYRTVMDHGLQQHKLEMLYKQHQAHQSREGIQFETGDKVKVFLAMAPARGGLATKLQARWAAGYVIADRHNAETWRVKRELGDGKSMPIHSSRLKPYMDPQDRKNLMKSTILHEVLQDRNSPYTPQEDDDTFESLIPQDMADVIILESGQQTELGDAEEISADVKLIRKDMELPLDEASFKSRIMGASPEWDVPLQHSEQTEPRKALRTPHNEGIHPNYEPLDEKASFNPDEKLDWIVDEAIPMPDSLERTHAEQVEISRKQPSTAQSKTRDGKLNCIQYNGRSTTLRGIADLLKIPLPTLYELNELYYHRNVRTARVKPGMMVHIGKLKVPSNWNVVKVDQSQVGEIPEEFTVERILDSKITSQGEMFQVQWAKLRGQSYGDLTWEPKDHLTCTNAMTAYKDRVLRGAFTKQNKSKAVLAKAKADKRARTEVKKIADDRETVEAKQKALAAIEDLSYTYTNDSADCILSIITNGNQCLPTTANPSDDGVQPDPTAHLDTEGNTRNEDTDDDMDEEDNRERWENVMAIDGEAENDRACDVIISPEESAERMKHMDVKSSEDAQEFLAHLNKTYGAFKYENVDNDNKRYINFQKAVNQLEGKAAKQETRKEQIGIKNVELNFGHKFVESKMMNIIMTAKQFNNAEKRPDTEQEISIEFKETDGISRSLGAMIHNITESESGKEVTLEVKVGERQTSDIEATRGDIFLKHRRNATERIQKAITDSHGGEDAGCTSLVNIIRNDNEANTCENRIGKYEAEWTKSLKPFKSAQLKSIQTAFKHRISAIQGPPGCGKTRVTTQLAAMAAHAFKKDGGKEKVVVVAPMNATVEDLVYQMSRIKDPGGNHIKVIWCVSRSHATLVSERTEPFTLGHASIYPPPGYERPLGQGNQDRLQALHQKRENRKICLTSSQLRAYLGLLKDAANRVIQSSQVIACTTLQLGAQTIKSQEYGLGIIEEAGLVTEPEAHLMIAASPRQMVFVGDEKQMQARFNAPEVERLGLESVFKRVVEINNIPKTLLDEQHRMPSSCIRPSNSIFYNGQIKTDKDMESKRIQQNKLSGIWKDPYLTAVWTDTAEIRDKLSKEDANQLKEIKQKGQNSSPSNIGEAKECVDIAKWIIETSGTHEGTQEKIFQAQHITILAMYTAQVSEIKMQLAKHGSLKNVEVQTVNQYQGRENKIIIISLVRTEPTRSDFLREPGRINVAITRCTHGYIMVGDLNNFKSLQDKDSKGLMTDSIWAPICKEITGIQGQLSRTSESRSPKANATDPEVKGAEEVNKPKLIEDSTKEDGSEKIATAHIEDADSIAKIEETSKEDGAPGKCEEDITGAESDVKANDDCTNPSTEKTEERDHRIKYRWLTMLQRTYYKMTRIANLGPNDTLEALQEPTGTQTAATGVEQERRMMALSQVKEDLSPEEGVPKNRASLVRIARSGWNQPKPSPKGSILNEDHTVSEKQNAQENNPKKNAILMGLRNAEIIAMLRRIAHTARELHAHTRRKGMSPIQASAKDVFGRRIYFKEIENQGLVMPKNDNKEWCHVTAQAKQKTGATEKRKDFIGRMLSTCLCRVEQRQIEAEYKMEINGFKTIEEDGHTRRVNKNDTNKVTQQAKVTEGDITKIIEMIADFTVDKDSRTDSKAERELEENKLSKSKKSGRDWMAKIRACAAGGFMDPPDLYHNGSEQEENSLEYWKERVEGAKHAHHIRHCTYWESAEQVVQREDEENINKFTNNIQLEKNAAYEWQTAVICKAAHKKACRHWGSRGDLHIRVMKEALKTAHITSTREQSEGITLSQSVTNAALQTLDKSTFTKAKECEVRDEIIEMVKRKHSVATILAYIIGKDDVNLSRWIERRPHGFPSVEEAMSTRARTLEENTGDSTIQLSGLQMIENASGQPIHCDHPCIEGIQWNLNSLNQNIGHMPQTGKSAPEDVIREMNQGQSGPFNRSNATSNESIDELLNSVGDKHIASVSTQAYPCQTREGEVPTVLVTDKKETETTIETVMPEDVAAVETVTPEEAGQNAAPTAEEEEINATNPEICSHDVKEWRQAETSVRQDGCHKMSLNLSRPGKSKPIWQEEAPGGTILCQNVVIRKNGETVRCYAESFGNWNEEVCNGKTDEWTIDIDILPNQGDVWEMFGILWEEPAGKEPNKISNKQEGLIEFKHTSPDQKEERSTLKCSLNPEHIWGNCMGSSEAFMSKVKKCKGNLLKRYCRWQRVERHNIIRGWTDKRTTRAAWRHEEEASTEALSKREMMSKLADLIEETGDPWEYVKVGEEENKIPKHILDDIRVPLRIGEVLSDSGSLEEESEGCQTYTSPSGTEPIRVSEAFWTKRAELVKKCKGERETLTPAELKEAKKTVIVRETDSMRRNKPDPDYPKMKIEEEHSSSRRNRFQREEFQREKGYNYSIPLWKGKNSTAQNMFNADEEVKRLAKYAESNRSKKFMMLQMPEATDWKEAMRTLTRVDNIHLRAEMWKHLEPEKLTLPTPKPIPLEKNDTINKKKSAKKHKGTSRNEKRPSEEQQADRNAS